MEEISFLECLREAWLNCGEFIQRKPLTVAVAFFTLLACNAAALALSYAHPSAPPTSAQRGIQLIITLFSVVVTLALPIKVMQLFMLGDHEYRAKALFGQEFWRYLQLGLAIFFGSIAVVGVLVGSVLLLSHLLGMHLVGWFLAVILGVTGMCIGCYVGVRLSLLFCHVAIGRKARWSASWNDTRGQFWKIFLSQILTILPLYACGIIVFALVRIGLGPTDKVVLDALVVIGKSFGTAASLIVGATCGCWLYQRFARTLLTLPD
jgi:hypothetical protein